MKLERLIFMLLTMMAATPAFAAREVSQTIKEFWGVGSIAKCNGSTVTSGDFCISTEEGRCTADASGMHFYVATNINDKGARFCPMYVRSYRRRTTQSPKTYYFKPIPGATTEEDCFWVCHDGFGGPECREDYTAKVGGCDASIERKTFGAKWGSLSKGDVVEQLTGYDYIDTDTFDYFHKDFLDCDDDDWKELESANNDHEHDIVLSIAGFTADGFGVFAQPLQVRAFAEQSSTDEAGERILAMPVGNRVIMCRSGYRINSAKSGCVPIDQVVCDTPKGVCDGWNEDTYPTETYRAYVRDGAGCYEFRCKQAGYAFRGNPDDMADFDATCVECPRETHTVTASGYCFKHEAVDAATGTVNTVNRDGEVTSVQMTGVTLQMMKDATAQIADDNSSKSCWMSHYESADEFRECMLKYLKDTGLLKQ